MIRRLISAGLAVVLLLSVACCPAFAAAASPSPAPVESSSPSGGDGLQSSPFFVFDGSKESISGVSVVFGPFEYKYKYFRNDYWHSGNSGQPYNISYASNVSKNGDIYWLDYNSLTSPSCYCLPAFQFLDSKYLSIMSYFASNYSNYDVLSHEGYYIRYLIPVDFSSVDFSKDIKFDFFDFFDYNSGINLISSYLVRNPEYGVPFFSSGKVSLGEEVSSVGVSFSNIVVSLVSGLSFDDSSPNFEPVQSFILDVVSANSVVVPGGSIDFVPDYISVYVPSSGVVNFSSNLLFNDISSKDSFIFPVVCSDSLSGHIEASYFESYEDGIIKRLDDIKRLIQELTGCQVKDILFNISRKLDDLGNMCNSFFRNANNFFSSVLSRLDGITALLGDAGGGLSGSLADESEELQNSTDQLQDAKPPASAPLGLFGVFGQIASFIGGGFSYVFDWFGWSDNSADFVYNSLGLVYSLEPDTSPVPIG